MAIGSLLHNMASVQANTSLAYGQATAGSMGLGTQAGNALGVSNLLTTSASSSSRLIGGMTSGLVGSGLIGDRSSGLVSGGLISGGLIGSESGLIGTDSGKQLTASVFSLLA